MGSTFEVTSATDLKLITLGYGTAAATGVDNSAALPVGKKYIVTATVGTDEQNYAGTWDHDANGGTAQVDTAAKKMMADATVYRGDNSNGTAITTGNMAVGDVLVVTTEIDTTDMNGTVRLKEVLTGETAFVAGQTYEIATMGSSDGVVDVSAFDEDAGAIARAVSSIADGAQLAVGTTFTVDADASVAEMAHLNALTQGMTFNKVTTDAAFREIDASQITRNIEAVQKKINTARVQAGSQYAALESAVIYTTDLTAQYELGYNTVHDVNFSMETAHLAKNQILQQAATAMLAQANQGQQGLLQLIQG